MNKPAELSVAGRKRLGDQAPYITFNLSARQFTDEDLLNSFIEILNATGADPKQLVVEITETSLMADTNTSMAFLEELRTIGMSVAVDDFGTGYSSLAQLLKINVDTLKIDRMFVNNIEENPDNQAVVAAICRMAKALKLKLVAEGVENEAQRDIMLSLGCQSSQGYLFYKPIPEEALLNIFESPSDEIENEQDRLQFLIYTSRVTNNMDEQGLNDILEQARSFNRRNRITGYLLFNDGVFLQYIEGPQSVIKKLFTSIARDPRHQDVTLLVEGFLDERLFIDWSMGFQALDKQNLLCRGGITATTKDFFAYYRDNPALCCNLFEAISRYEM